MQNQINNIPSARMEEAMFEPASKKSWSTPGVEVLPVADTAEGSTYAFADGDTFLS